MKTFLTSRKIRLFGTILVVGFVALNVSAYFHARAMTHFSSGSHRTPPPEKLTTFGKIRVLLTGMKLNRPQNRKRPQDIGLDYKTVTTTGAHGLQLECWWLPQDSSRAIVVLFHGYGASKESMLLPAKTLQEMGYSTLLVDFHGSGGSAGNETSIGFFEADDVAAATALAGKLQAGQPVILLGNSMGAAAILRAVHMGKAKPHGLILERPFDRLLSTVENRFRAMKLPSFPLAHVLVFWGGMQHGYNGFQYNPCDYTKNVQCPALLMVGENDPRVTTTQTKNILRNLSLKTFKKFNDLKHESYLAARPDEWRSTVGQFLNQTIPGSSVSAR